MRFVLTRDIRHNPTIRLLLSFYLIGILIYLGLMPILEQHNLGLTMMDLERNILGDPEAFLEPISLKTLVELTHIKLFTQLITLITVFAAFVRLPYSEKFKISAMAGLFAVTLSDSLAPFLVPYLQAPFLFIKFISFWLFEGGMAFVTLVTLIYLLRPSGNKHVSS